MSRLASFHGPSTPAPTHSRAKAHTRSPGGSPSSSRSVESTFHRKTRTALQDFRNASETWNDLVCSDGVRILRSLTDTRTELDNEIKALPDPTKPRRVIATPRIAIMEIRVAELDALLQKLQRTFVKMNGIVDNLESLLSEAFTMRGYKFVHVEPLWCTWTMEKFLTESANLLPAYHRSLQKYRNLVDRVRRHSTSFESAKKCIAAWAEQPLLDDQWDELEQFFAVEVEAWTGYK